ncbi:MAG: hypothetical protein HYT70_00435 [Candidatus Aenigmarchaeota archaeon]|nr:hypothetical protein [Candidatus Aenigmarchaeota archaeon]
MEVFSKEEIRDIVASVIALIIIFAWQPFPGFGFSPESLPYFVAVVIVAFLFHEMAHKFMAQKFGLAAHYRMWPTGILFGMIFMVVGLKFVAPGAVEVRPYKFGRWGYRRMNVQSTEMGIVATMGPLTNIAFAMIFSLFQGTLFYYLTLINAWLALVNLLPIPPLDGSKIVIWKPWIWGMMIATALILVALFAF